MTGLPVLQEPYKPERSVDVERRGKQPPAAESRVGVRDAPAGGWIQNATRGWPTSRPGAEPTRSRWVSISSGVVGRGQRHPRDRRIGLRLVRAGTGGGRQDERRWFSAGGGLQNATRGRPTSRPGAELTRPRRSSAGRPARSPKQRYPGVPRCRATPLAAGWRAPSGWLIVHSSLSMPPRPGPRRRPDGEEREERDPARRDARRGSRAESCACFAHPCLARPGGQALRFGYR